MSRKNLILSVALALCLAVTTTFGRPGAEDEASVEAGSSKVEKPNDPQASLAERVAGIEATMSQVLERLNHLETGLEEGMRELRAELKGLRGELGAELRGLRSELGAELRGLRSDRWVMIGTVVAVWAAVIVVLLKR